MKFPDDDSIMAKKVAFMFLTYDELHVMNAWKEFFKNVPLDQYNIYVHAKEKKKIRDPWLKSKIISESTETSWGDITLVKATLLLMKEAFFDDEENTHFVLLSGSCIPLWNFNHIYEIIMRNDRSFFTAQHACPHDRYDHIKDKAFFNYDKMWWQHQWMYITRNDTEFFLENDHLDDFEEMPFADEHYFINILSMNDVSFSRGIMTHVTWVDKYGRKKARPIEYGILTKTLLSEARNTGAMFIRKMKKDATYPRNLY